MINSRAKGKTGELEIVKLLCDELGVDATRNWREQAAVGGSDILGVPGWAIEVKRQKKFDASWWQQTAEQAARADLDPVLLYRLDRKPWMARCCICSIVTGYGHFQIEMGIMDWITIAREHMDDRSAHDQENMQGMRKTG